MPQRNCVEGVEVLKLVFRRYCCSRQEMKEYNMVSGGFFVTVNWIDRCFLNTRHDTRTNRGVRVVIEKFCNKRRFFWDLYGFS